MTKQTRVHQTPAVDQPRCSSASRDPEVLEQLSELIPGSSRLTSERRNSLDDQVNAVELETFNRHERTSVSNAKSSERRISNVSLWRSAARDHHVKTRIGVIFNRRRVCFSQTFWF